MRTISDNRNTLNNFINLFDTYEIDMDCKHNFESNDIADDNSLAEQDKSLETFGTASSSVLTRLIFRTEKRMTWNMNKKDKACVAAMIDSVYENHGLLECSYEAIAAEYAPMFGELKVRALNQARVFLLHQGPVLGLASKNSEEFKWVIARHFVAGDFVRDMAGQNQQLTTCFKHLHQGGKQAIHGFSALCGCIYQQAKAPRRLGATKVKSLLKCDDKTAQLLAEVYAALPEAPLA